MDKKILKQILDDEKEAKRLEQELQGLKAEAEAEKQRQEMIGKPIQWREKLKLSNEDVPMTEEERAEKWPMIPTRVETKNGTWEIVDGYKGIETLVGFRSKTAHEIGPLGERAYAIVLTVSEWDALHDEMDQAMNMMKL